MPCAPSYGLNKPRLRVSSRSPLLEVDGASTQGATSLPHITSSTTALQGTLPISSLYSSYPAMVQPRITLRWLAYRSRMRRLTWQSWRLSRRQTTNSRSEEHTSELQSRFDLVCRLLLEKKKINQLKITTIQIIHDPHHSVRVLRAIVQPRL